MSIFGFFDIFRTKASANTSSNSGNDSKGNNSEVIIGPYRVFPGRLSVKLKKY